MIALLRQLTRLLRPPRRSRTRYSPAIEETHRIRRDLDAVIEGRRHDVVVMRNEQMQLRRDIRANLSIQGRIAGDYRRELGESR